MKGSTYSRKVIKDLKEVENTLRIKSTLKDIDFLNIE